MIPGKILQDTLEGASRITGASLALYDKEGELLASSGGTSDFPERLRIVVANGDFRCLDPSDHFCVTPVESEGETEYAVAAAGSCDWKMIAELTALQISCLQEAVTDTADREEFFKDLLLNRALPSIIFSKAAKLHIAENAPRAVILLECGLEKVPGVLARIDNSFAESGISCHVGTAEVGHIVLIPELISAEENREVLRIAEKAAETAGSGTRSACGPLVTDLKDLARSYQEAKTALEIGNIFMPDTKVVSCESLGIARLIYQLPLPLCRTFIREVFGDHSSECLEPETITTIERFFENDLNVSETARRLYIHRNTLVYRLDKIQKTTGLDLRKLEDAVTFRIALMVVRYTKYLESVKY